MLNFFHVKIAVLNLARVTIQITTTKVSKMVGLPVRSGWSMPHANLIVFVLYGFKVGCVSWIFAIYETRMIFVLNRLSQSPVLLVSG